LAAVGHVERNNSGMWVFMVLLLGLAMLVMCSVARPSQAPSVNDVQVRPHAVEKHGNDAIVARAGITACKSPRSRWLGGGTEGVGWAVWCETGTHLCPGMYISAGGVEKTAFIRPCYQWRGQ